MPMSVRKRQTTAVEEHLELCHTSLPKHIIFIALLMNDSQKERRAKERKIQKVSLPVSLDLEHL